MDLTTLKNYFEACCGAETDLQQYWLKFYKLPSYSLFKIIAPQSQSKIDASLIRQFILSFNWQTLLSSVQSLDQSNYRIYSLSAEMNPDQLLDLGLDLLLAYWGTYKSLTFDQFSLIVKGEKELPNKEVEVPFPQKKVLFECLMKEMQNLIKLESIKKIVYHEYKNLSDLFETVTSTKIIEKENIQRLFLSFSQRKNEKEMERISKRAKLPWDFNHFLQVFKRTSDAKANQYKIYHSATRNKNQAALDKAFTTPRKQKFAFNQSSTKLTKGQSIEQEFETTTAKKFPGAGETQQYVYIQVMADLLAIEEDFIKKCGELIKRKDFDLELVYERHGKKFEKVLNQRYGVCNFSAFVRFIVPRDYEHRYLSFIRYQADNTLSSETEKNIDLLLDEYEKKEAQIVQIWKRCDKEMLMRYFCKPREESIRNQKLRETFTTREAKILLERLDPHRKGNIQLQALN